MEKEDKYPNLIIRTGNDSFTSNDIEFEASFELIYYPEKTIIKTQVDNDHTQLKVFFENKWEVNWELKGTIENSINIIARELHLERMKNGNFYFDKEVAFGVFCAKLVAKKNFRYYLYSFTQSDFFNSTIKNVCLGTNINNLNGSLVNGFKVIIPSNVSIETFNSQVSFEYKKIANNQKQNQQFTELRDWLLPMLMNGQVTVGEAEEQMNMAVEPSVEYKKFRK